MVSVDFTIVEVRMIQHLWETKPIEYIANMLDRSTVEVSRKIADMSKAYKVVLYERPQFERKVKQREVEWAKKQLAAPVKMKIPDNSGKVSVIIDSKTTVFCYPQDVDRIKKKYGVN